MPSGLRAPLSDAIQSDLPAQHKLADLMSAQNLLIFLQSCVEIFQLSPPDQNSSEIWTLMLQMLSGTAMTLHLLVLGIMRSACHIWAKFQHDMFKDAPAKVQEKLLISPLISSQPVHSKKAQAAFKVTPQVVKVVTQPPPKPQPSKPPSASVKPSSNSQ